jgi:hypothetical protein
VRKLCGRLTCYGVTRGAVTFDSHFAPHSQLRKLVFCNSGLDSRLPFGGFHEVHAHGVYARVHAHEVHACEVRIYEVHTHEMQACEVHAPSGTRT